MDDPAAGITELPPLDRLFRGPAGRERPHVRDEPEPLLADVERLLALYLR